MPVDYSRRDILGGLIAAGAACAAPAGSTLAAGSAGNFIGRILTEWLPDGRLMKLIEPITYTAPDGRPWPVPKDTVVDGASIPSVFWSLIGGPFDGPYRAPSIIHDYYSDKRDRKCLEVHKVFYDAMLTAGVGPQKAWLMYQAVSRFGPQWVGPHKDLKCVGPACGKPPTVRVPKADKADLLAFTQEMQASADPRDISELKRIAERAP